jgi:DNA-binding beta-propeller fold protein YncE
MKIFTIAFLALFLTSLTLSSQVSRPVFTLKDEPGISHNAHITSDGKFYYTCNGGTDKDGNPRGKINKYTLSGELVKSYPFKKFDMRSIMYNKSDKHLYIATYDLKIYKIIDLESGTTELHLDKKYKNGQCAIALDPDGKTFYIMDGGSLTLCKFKDGSVIKSFSGLSFGADDKDNPGLGKYGSTAVAVDKNYIYTWDAHFYSRKIYAYDKKGNFVKAYPISNGNFGYTLSYANDLIFVAMDGKGQVGLWYGYRLAEK